MDSKFDQIVGRAGVGSVEGAPKTGEQRDYTNISNLEIKKKHLERENERITNLKDDIELNNGKVP